MVATDGSIYKVEPACVVYPKDDEDVRNALGFAYNYGLSVHSRGAGSGLCGSAIGKGLILDFSKYMNKLLKIDYENQYFECEPGYRFGELEEELKGSGLFFPPDPSSGEYATFGGMLGTNASGAHSVKYGNVSDYIEDAFFYLSDGSSYSLSEIRNTEIQELPDTFRKLAFLYENNKNIIHNNYPNVKYNVSGYNMRDLVKDNKLDLSKLIAGSEGTLAVVTKMRFRLKKKPSYNSLIVAYFDDIVSSSKAVQQILPMNPSGIEIMDKSLLQIAKDNDESLREKIPDGIDNVLLIEFDGNDKDALEHTSQLAQNLLRDESLTENIYLAITEEDKTRFWAIRKAAVPILYKLKGKKKILALIEDAAVPTDKLVEYFEGVYNILKKNGVDFVVYGHIAKGLMHTRPLLNLKDPHDIDLLKNIADDFFSLINSMGGSISGEHGDGRIRTQYIKKQYPEIYELFHDVKHLFDESNLFNPEIKTHHDNNQISKFLRYGKDYRSEDLKNKLLMWPEQFADEVEKCHGCSKCTTVTTATRMCPIYKFTRDEAASPKAKANILRMLISGSIDEESLYEKAFQHVIEHCVNCGSCYSECPSNVNIPKMSIEARGQYEKKFGSSLENKLIVNAELAGRTTRKFSKFIGFPMKLKAARKIGEIFTGVSAEREFITFPSKSLYERVSHKEGAGDIKVLYFAGCYASYIKPEIGEAAVKVLERMAVETITPEQHCCGLPMLSKGMVKKAKNKVKANLEKWGKLLDDVDYIVVTCSSCGLSLTQEWSYLVEDEKIDVIKDKFIHISDFINKYRSRLQLKETSKKVAYHMPCHLKLQKASNSSIDMLSSINGLQVEDLASHCCGIAGSWGISAKNYPLSVEIASPMINKLNASEADTGVTDCPTCRMQMEHLSSKKIKHPVEVLSECLK
ncbi:MAG: anaerobic glycerol-3-phosphate dehydrogenase subunit C, partial [Flexistipes sinusarabici]